MGKKRKISIKRESKKTRKKQKSFTLLEIMVVLAIIVIVAVIFFALINPKKQIEKSWDGKRKNELSAIGKVMEDFYNDKSCYPKPEEICYKDKDQLRCPVCGSETTSPAFSPYLSRLPCDPEHPRKDFLYEADDSSCSNWFRIYSQLSNTADLAIEEAGCKDGCGPGFVYSYGISSPNTDLLNRENSVAGIGGGGDVGITGQ